MRTAIRFVAKDKKNFFVELRKRVNQHFEDNQISKNYNGLMIFKSVLLISLYVVPFIVMLLVPMSNWIRLVLSVVMGTGIAGIGMSVMHDGNHGSYSTNKWVNSFFGTSLDLLGACSFNWKIQHNVNHHTYTNIHNHDEDLEAGIIIRLCPDAPHKWFHQYQHIYGPVIYGLMTLSWIILKDFIRFKKYKETGQIQENGSTPNKLFAKIIGIKVLYIASTIVLPLMVMTNLAWWQFIIGFVTMHMTAGFILALIFQLAHLVDDLDQPMPNSIGTIENNWAIHQLATTANFAKGNPLITFYVGGLNYQVEHHLFPRICHVHYPAISKIVAETAAEFDVPYHDLGTFTEAFGKHVKFLKRMGDIKTVARKKAA